MRRIRLGLGVFGVAVEMEFTIFDSSLRGIYSTLGMFCNLTVLFRFGMFQLGKESASTFQSRDTNVQAHIVYKNRSLFDSDMTLIDKW